MNHHRKLLYSVMIINAYLSLDEPAVVFVVFIGDGNEDSNESTEIGED